MEQEGRAKNEDGLAPRDRRGGVVGYGSIWLCISPYIGCQMRLSGNGLGTGMNFIMIFLQAELRGMLGSV